MRRMLCFIFVLTLFAAPLAAAGGEAQLLPEDPAAVRERDEARLIELGFLSRPGSDEAYAQAVREFQGYLNRLSAGTPDEELPATTLEVLRELEEDAARALSIKELPTYSDVDSIAAFRTYAVVDNEGELGGEDPLELPEPAADDGSPDPATGALDEAQRTRLHDPALPVYRQALAQGADGSEVRRVQRRLTSLKFTDHAIDGMYDKKTAEAVRLFQRASDLPATGGADRATQEALFSPDAVPNDQPLYDYLLRVDTAKQTVRAYAWADGEYARLAREMTCSTGLDGTPTPEGAYRATGPVARWCYFPSYGCWAQYAFRIKGGVLFHSVLYRQAKESTLIKGSVLKLGQKSSHGCVRLSVEDAKWIFEHCTAGTTVIVE